MSGAWENKGKDRHGGGWRSIGKKWVSRNGRKTERVGGMSVITARVDKCDLKCYFKNKLIFTQICAVLCLVYGLLFGDPGTS